MMRLVILGLCLVPGFASGELDQWDKNNIRKHYQESVFNRPAEVSNKPVDQRYAEKLFPETVTVDRPAYAPLPEIPDVQVFTGREIAFERFISLISKTIGYDSPVFLQVPVSIKQRPIILNSEIHSLPDLVAWLELKTSTRIAVYPDSKMIQVTARDELISRHRK